MTHVNLTNVHVTSGGVEVPDVTVSVRGVAYTLPAPQYGLTGVNRVCVCPFAEADEEGNSIRLRLDKWRVVCDLGRRFRSLPLNLADMATAVRAAKEFESDPGIDWEAPPEELEAWAVIFLERERERARQDGDR